MYRKMMFLVAVFGLMWSVPTANGAEITWDDLLPVDVPLNAENVIEAINLGGSAVADVGGVDFAAGNGGAAAPQHSNFFDYLISSWSGPTGSGDFVTDAGLATVITSLRYKGGYEAMPLELNNLTPGTPYMIQIYTGDQRGCCSGRAYIFGDGLGNQSEEWSRGSLMSLVGHFVADGTEQNIPMYLADGSRDPSLTGYVLSLDDTTSMAQSPDPYNNQGIIDTEFVAVGSPITLSWGPGLVPDPDNEDEFIPNPDITGYYVYVNDDPNMTDVTPDSVTETSYEIAALDYGVTKYWRVDLAINDSAAGDEETIIGNPWSFATAPAEPVVDAGGDLYTTLELAQAGIALNGIVSDADNTVTGSLWTILSDDQDYPGGTQTLGDPASPATSFTSDTAGRFLLKLEAIEPSYPGVEFSEIIEVFVVEDACEAAKNGPDGFAANAMDFNEDCYVSMEDFALFAAQWLESTSLTETTGRDGNSYYLALPGADMLLGQLIAPGAKDGWSANCIISKSDSYTNTTGADQTLDISVFTFYATNGAASPVTPFVVELVGESVDPNSTDFNVLAVGTTRTADDYAANAQNTFNFNDGSVKQITIADGATIAIGFLDAAADGTGGVAGGSVIPQNKVEEKNIWYSGGGSPTTDSASVVEGSPPTPGPNELYLARDYSFMIGFDY